MHKIGIICASDDELAPFLPHIEISSTTKKAMLTFYEGVLCGIRVVALYSGVCKVNAAIAAQILIDQYGIDAIINAGTAGGMDEKIALFDAIISTQVAYHDVEDDVLTEFHPWLPSVYLEADQALLKIAHKLFCAQKDVYFGRMVTGEQFIQEDRRDAINHKYAPLSVDMETASIAHVCHVNQIPFLAIRAITDTATHIGVENFEKNCEQASEISKNLVLQLLTEIKRMQ